MRILLGAAGQPDYVVWNGLSEVEILSGERRLAPADAVRAAYAALGIEGVPDLSTLSISPEGLVTYRNPAGDPFTSIAPELIAFPVSTEEVIPAWRMYVEINRRRWYEIIVAAEDGRLLARHNLYRKAAQGRVWKESPAKGPRELLPFQDWDQRHHLGQ